MNTNTILDHFTLINQDCTVAADQIANGSVDLLLTDPPYNISDGGAKPEWIDPETGQNKNTIHSQRFSESFEQDWDSVSHEEFLHIKPGGTRTFNADAEEHSIVERYARADKVASIVYKLIKDHPTYALSQIMAMAEEQAQTMLDSRKRKDDIVECVIPNTLTYSGGLGRDKIHPTQKPTEILEYFVALLSRPGDTVLDTFAGSGSTGVAAHNQGRRSILIERDTKMFAAMAQRIASLR